MPKSKSNLVVDYDEDKIGWREQLKTSLPRLKLLFKLVHRITPKFVPLISLNALIRSAQIAIVVFIPKFFIDALTKQVSWEESLALITLATVAEGLLRLGQQALTRYLDVEQVRFYHGMNQTLAEKITRLPYSNLEDPAILTLKDEASFTMINQDVATSFVTQLREILQQVLTLLTLFSILSQLSLLLVLFIMVIVVVIALLQNSIKRYETKFFLNIVGVNRKFGYYVNSIYAAEYQEQIRLYHLDPMLTERVDVMNLELCDYMSTYFIKVGRVAALQSILTDLQAAVAYGYAAVRVLSDIAGPRIGIGSFSLYAAASIQFTAALRAILTALRDIKQSLDYLQPFERFMNLPEQAIALTILPADETKLSTDGYDSSFNRFSSIAFEDVSFTYPGTDQAVLNHVSFSIKRGEKISVVGLNGAGKTTLVKLLCRFFKPDAGRILVNGRDIQAWPEKAYLKEIAAVFQDFRLLPFSVQSNISSKSDEAIDERDRLRLLEICRESSVQSIIDRLDQGLETLLNKSINREGTELSGGQAQKLAIARALFKGASLVILDEPTSALDPLAEAEIYEHFDALVQGQTAIYISHRMSSSRFCDKVLVLDGGTVTGFAHHDELIKDGDSLYSQLFQEQKQYYTLT